MKEIADIIQKEIRDPRIAGVISITDIDISHDNSYAKVYFSVFADEKAKQASIEALEENTSRIRYEVGKRVRLRLTPELRFIPDDSLERGTKVMDLIDKISRGELK
jgi:ribosome-binding factor A